MEDTKRDSERQNGSNDYFYIYIDMMEFSAQELMFDRFTGALSTLQEVFERMRHNLEESGNLSHKDINMAINRLSIVEGIWNQNPNSFSSSEEYNHYHREVIGEAIMVASTLLDNAKSSIENNSFNNLVKEEIRQQLDEAIETIYNAETHFRSMTKFRP
ncbi:hypothetical protein [Haladaptatus caseinilyticus]|uniref:hypothetical protein n=1 Tax=Haladaptatus caseinilyticus TaxID=2993314 RepID=UPI00224B5AE4|nr:hypothetical protein [Haladaptatus caseinilyticus]